MVLNKDVYIQYSDTYPHHYLGTKCPHCFIRETFNYKYEDFKQEMANNIKQKQD